MQHLMVTRYVLLLMVLLTRLGKTWVCASSVAMELLLYSVGILALVSDACCAQGNMRKWTYLQES